MNDELQKKLIEWIQKLGDIASEQLPDFAQQIVAYKIWSCTIWMWGAIAILAILFLIFVGTLSCYFTSTGRDKDDFGGASFFIFAFSIVISCVVIKNYAEIKKCEVAPKIVIIDYIKGS